MHREKLHDFGLQQISVGLTNEESVGRGANTHAGYYQVWLENILIYRGMIGNIIWKLNCNDTRVWSGFISVRVGIIGGLLWTRKWTSGFHRIWGKFFYILDCDSVRGIRVEEESSRRVMQTSLGERRVQYLRRYVRWIRSRTSVVQIVAKFKPYFMLGRQKFLSLRTMKCLIGLALTDFPPSKHKDLWK